MSLIDVARDTLRDLPVSDIIRERLSLAFDRVAETEAKNEEIKAHLARVEARLEIECLNHSKTQDELQRLKNEHAEEIRIHRFIEFRRGKRTAGKWAAFCPKCHMPVANKDGEIDVTCSDRACKWHVRLDNIPLSQAIKELEV